MGEKSGHNPLYRSESLNVRTIGTYGQVVVGVSSCLVHAADWALPGLYLLDTLCASLPSCDNPNFSSTCPPEDRNSPDWGPLPAILSQNHAHIHVPVPVHLCCTLEIQCELQM